MLCLVQNILFWKSWFGFWFFFFFFFLRDNPFTWTEFFAVFFVLPAHWKGLLCWYPDRTFLWNEEFHNLLGKKNLDHTTLRGNVTEGGFFCSFALVATVATGLHSSKDLILSLQLLVALYNHAFPFTAKSRKIMSPVCSVGYPKSMASSSHSCLHPWAPL